MKSLAFILVFLANTIAFAAGNPCSDVANSVPEYEDGAKKIFKGCRLEYIEPGSLYGELGLSVGDVVTPPSKVEVKNEPKLQKVDDLDSLEFKKIEFKSAEIGIED